MPNGNPEEEIQAAKSAQLGQEQGMRPEVAAAGLYPLSGEDLLKEIRQAKTPKELQGVAQEVFAVKEGLVFGDKLWDLEDPNQLVFLMNLFGTIESGTKRESLYYPEAELLNRVQGGVRMIKKRAWEEGRRSVDGLTEKEKGEISRLIEIENQRQAREIFDLAYQQRMSACEQAELTANLLSKDPNYRPARKPDKGHFEMFFSGVFGERVNNALEQIVAFVRPEKERKEAMEARVRQKKASLQRRIKEGEITQDEARSFLSEYEEKLKKRFLEIPEFTEAIKEAEDLEGSKVQNIYVRGLTKSTKDFKIWLEKVLEAADYDMGAAWAAWRVALTFEIISQFGIIKQLVKKDKARRPIYKFIVGDPPIVGDLWSWTVDIMAKRLNEWGLDSEGRVRLEGVRHLTHTGYPVSIKYIREIYPSYLHASIVPTKKGGKERLWDIWWKKGVGLHEEEFPWALTEVQPLGLDTTELPPGSFGFWRLNGLRAWAVVGDIRSRPSLRDLSDSDFFAKRARNWDKVFGEMPGYKPEKDDDKDPCKNPTHPYNNPRFWWVAGILIHSHPGNVEKSNLLRGDPESFYRTYYGGEIWSDEKRGMGKGRPISVWEILDHALQSGFLRKKDVSQLEIDLDIPRRRF